MEQEWKKDRGLWRKVQVGKCIRVVLIFLGILLMQMIAYMLYVIGYILFHMAKEVPVGQSIRQLQVYIADSDSSLLIGVSALSAVLCLIWCGILYGRSDWRQKDFSYRQAFSGRRLLGIAELFIGPASEELIFRGAVMDRLKIAFPFWLANALQAALFGLYHMNVVQGIYAFLLGMVLGLVGDVTGSIFATILTHIIFNGTSYLLEICFNGTGIYETVGAVAVLLFAVLCFKEGLGYYLAEWRKGHTEGGTDWKNVV